MSTPRPSSLRQARCGRSCAPQLGRRAADLTDGCASTETASSPLWGPSGGGHSLIIGMCGPLRINPLLLPEHPPMPDGRRGAGLAADPGARVVPCDTSVPRCAVESDPITRVMEPALCGGAGGSDVQGQARSPRDGSAPAHEREVADVPSAVSAASEPIPAGRHSTRARSSQATVRRGGPRSYSRWCSPDSPLPNVDRRPGVFGVFGRNSLTCSAGLGGSRLIDHTIPA